MVRLRVHSRPLAGVPLTVLSVNVWTTYPRMRRIGVWCLAYLWTAVGAVAISHTAGWQYDGDVGWWLVVAYTFPAFLIATPLLWLFGDGDSGVVACLAALAILSIAAAIVRRRPREHANGS